MCATPEKPQCKLVAEGYPPPVLSVLLVIQTCWKWIRVAPAGQALFQVIHCSGHLILSGPFPARGLYHRVHHIQMRSALGIVRPVSCPATSTGLPEVSGHPQYVWQASRSLNAADVSFHTLLLVLEKQSKKASDYCIFIAKAFYVQGPSIPNHA